MFPKHHCRIVRWKRNRRENKDEDDEDDAEEQDDEVGEYDDDEERMIKNLYFFDFLQKIDRLVVS